MDYLVREPELTLYVWLISAGVATLTRFLFVRTLEGARGSLLFEMLFPLLVGLAVAFVGRRWVVSPFAKAELVGDDDTGAHERAVRQMALVSRIAVVALTVLCVTENLQSHFVPGRGLTWLVLLAWWAGFGRVLLAR